MRVAIFQGEGVGGRPSRDALIDIWKEELKDVPEIEKITFFRRQAEEDCDVAFSDADAVLGTFIPNDFFTKEFCDRHPDLKYVSCGSHGYGRIDFKLLKERGIFFTNTVYSQRTIAEYAFALLNDICHDVALHSNYYKKEHFMPENYVSRTSWILTPQLELYEKTIGIIGLGNIGLCAAQIAKGYGMKVLAYSRTPKEGPEYEGIIQVPFQELLAQSDIISIHCPLTDNTRGMLDREAFQSMKKGVILINTARGEIIEEQALEEALQDGTVYAAGLDVLSGEPLKEPCSLMKYPNVKVTPHIAWAPAESRIRGVHVEARQFKDWLKGKPVHNLAE